MLGFSRLRAEIIGAHRSTDEIHDQPSGGDAGDLVDIGSRRDFHDIHSDNPAFCDQPTDQRARLGKCASSPLRRYVDLVNQWQLIAVLRDAGGETTPPFSAKSENLLGAIAAFDAAYTAYADFQDTMERYWCLKWLEQHGYVRALPASDAAEPAQAADAAHEAVLEGEVVRDGLVRLDQLPMRIAVAGLPPLDQGARVRLQVRGIDEWRLTVDAVFAGQIATPETAVAESPADTAADAEAAAGSAD